MRKRSVLYLQVSVALYSLAANFAHPIEPAFFQKLNLPDYTFGVAFACMAFACFLFSPFWGKIAERIGIAKVMAIGYGGYCMGSGSGTVVCGVFHRGGDGLSDHVHPGS